MSSLLPILLGINVAIQFQSVVESKGLSLDADVYTQIQGIDIDSSVISLIVSIISFIISLGATSEKPSTDGKSKKKKPKGFFGGKTLDVVVVGCGLPKRGMGWYHLIQLLENEDVTVAGVIEPFFCNAKLCATPPPSWTELVNSLKADHGVPCADSVTKLPKFTKDTLCLIAGRTADNPALFKGCVDHGAKFIYLEKPGAPSVVELQEMADYAKSKGVKVYLGYNKNVTPYVQKALKKSRTVDGAHVQFVHNNSYGVNELNECFSRNAEGMMKNMAIHELAVIVSFFNVTVDSIAEFKVNKSPEVTESLTVWKPGTAMPDAKYITDFSRVGFTVTTKTGESVSIAANRCGGNVSHASVADGSGREVAKFEFPDADTQAKVDELCAADPEMMPYFFVQSDDYLVLKDRVIKSALKGGEAEDVATIQTAIEALKLAEYCTKELTAAMK